MNVTLRHAIFLINGSAIGEQILKDRCKVFCTEFSSTRTCNTTLKFHRVFQLNQHRNASWVTSSV